MGWVNPWEWNGQSSWYLKRFQAAPSNTTWDDRGGGENLSGQRGIDDSRGRRAACLPLLFMQRYKFCSERDWYLWLRNTPKWKPGTGWKKMSVTTAVNWWTHQALDAGEGILRLDLLALRQISRNPLAERAYPFGFTSDKHFALCAIDNGPARKISILKKAVARAYVVWQL